MQQTADRDRAFLEQATFDRLEAAVAWNHREWMTLKAIAAGGEVRHGRGVTWTCAGPHGEAMILFPSMSDADAGDELDAVVQDYRARGMQAPVGCWSLYPTSPADLDVRLLARGFQTGWQPCWMWVDLEHLRADHARPDGLEVVCVNGALDWDVADLPYYSREIEAIRHAAECLGPRRVWHFAATLGGRPVAHSTLCMTTGPLGVAGLYDVGVVPEARRRGIGKAITVAACVHARDMGCRYAMLNGTGERMYRELGFERLGHGRTWWLNVPQLEASPPTPAQIAFSEAVGRGDVEALDALAARGTVRDLDAPLANGMTLVQLAAHAGQRPSAEWLADYGATLDVVSAWDLGWKDRLPGLLDDRPDLASRPAGPMQATPLHEAAHRNDVELARVVLAASPDLGIRDGRFHATPLEWARYGKAWEIVGLIERHRGRAVHAHDRHRSGPPVPDPNAGPAA